MRNGIFISYRRKDTEGEASRLAEDLREGLDGVQIFRDVENIAPGEDFVVALERALADCAVMLVMIGPTWLETNDADGKRRLDDPADWTRLEIATGLKRDVRVIPVTCRGAELPAANVLPEDIVLLARRQAVEIDNNRWRYDVDHLIDRLVQIPGMRKKAKPSPTPSPTPQPVEKPSVMRKGLLMGGSAVAGIVLFLVWVIGSEFSGADSDIDPESARKAAELTQRILENTTATGRGAAGAAPPVAVQAPTAPPPQTAAQPPAATRTALRDVSGTWRTNTGEVYVFEQDGQQISITAGMNGVVVGAGRGQLTGSNLQIGLMVAANGTTMSVNCNMTGAPDNRSYTGICNGPQGQFPAHFFR